jgi:cellulose synthase/poly-beta-1,6-N-acetylglucosamine synthase-like glycosyltransferase
MTELATVVFWTSAILVVYAYVAYPALLWVLTRGHAGVLPPEAPADSVLPTISVLIVAHNEERFIRERIENLLLLDYPADKLELAVASDGSRDRTNDIVREYAQRSVRLFDYQKNSGKAAALDATVPQLRGEIAVLSDANTMMEVRALRLLARWFSDPQVGVVCGKLVLTDPVTGLNVDSMYWRYETFLKRCEGKLGGLLGANGAIYAIRRSVFPGIHPSTIVDDFVIPLVARIRTGCRLIYDESAVAYEETPPDLGMEFRRRTRIGAGDFQSLALVRPLLNPRQGWITFTFVSHKLLRWLCPFFLIAIAVSNIVLVDRGFYGVALLAQAGLYGLALLGRFLSHRSAAGRVMRLATMFATMNAALLVGFFRWAAGSQRAAWDRTVR